VPASRRAGAARRRRCVSPPRTATSPDRGIRTCRSAGGNAEAPCLATGASRALACRPTRRCRHRRAARAPQCLAKQPRQLDGGSLLGERSRGDAGRVSQFGCPARLGRGASLLVRADELMGAPRGSLSLISISIVDDFSEHGHPGSDRQGFRPGGCLYERVWSGDLSQHLSRRSNRGGDGRRGPPASEWPMKAPEAANHSSRALKGTMSGSACWSPTSTRWRLR
jgi:hypothetical protein